MVRKCAFWVLLIAFISASAHSLSAQTSAFNYQGRLTDAGNPANGSFQMQFKLFDSLAGPTQIGSTINDVAVIVTQGVFSVKLDFGVAPLSGTNRWIEIAVRRNSGESYVTLAPREQIVSSPYSVRTLSAATADNALSLGGVAANMYVQTSDSRLSDARNPLPNSANYIQNSASQQAASNFNISGNGTAGGTLSGSVVNAATQFNLGGSRLLGSSGMGNLFVGQLSGFSNSTGDANLFVGRNAGFSNTTGSSNSFVGRSAGSANTTGNSNSFVGFAAGLANTTGDGNSFFGASAGSFNTTGFGNSFFGNLAGERNSLGIGNSFFGAGAGQNTTEANANSFFGANAGNANITGDNNSFLGAFAGQSNTQGQNNVFVGANSGRSTSSGNDNTFVGSFAGQNNTTGGRNSYFGLGAGAFSTGSNNSFFGWDAGFANTTGSENTIIGYFANVGSANLTNATAIGANAVVSQSNSLVLGNNARVGIGTSSPQATFHISASGALTHQRITDTTSNNSLVFQAGSGSNMKVTGYNYNTNTAVPLYLGVDGADTYLNGGGGRVGIGLVNPDQTLTVNGNASKTAGGTTWAVFSDERLKDVHGSYSRGLSALMQLRPIRFTYRTDNALGLPGTNENIGFSAQEVQKVIPEAVTRSTDGYLQLQSDPILWTMLNAVKEQQQIIERQQRQIEALTRLFCEAVVFAAICKEEK